MWWMWISLDSVRYIFSSAARVIVGHGHQSLFFGDGERGKGKVCHKRWAGNQSGRLGGWGPGRESGIKSVSLWLLSYICMLRQKSPPITNENCNSAEQGYTHYFYKGHYEISPRPVAYFFYCTMFLSVFASWLSLMKVSLINHNVCING